VTAEALLRAVFQALTASAGGRRENWAAGSPLTVLTPIAPGRLEELGEYFGQLRGDERSPLADVPETHLGRWVIIDRLRNPDRPQALGSPHLLFSAIYDGELDGYLESLRVRMAAAANTIWGCCIGYPGTGDAESFPRYFREARLPADMALAAYPRATAEEVRSSLELQKKLLDFAMKAQDKTSDRELHAAYHEERGKLFEGVDGRRPLHRRYSDRVTEPGCDPPEHKPRVTGPTPHRPPRLEIDDIQGNVVRSCGLDHACFTFVRVGPGGAEGGRAFLGELAESVPDARERRPERPLNVALTYAGLDALGVSPEVLETFPPEFREGMAARAEEVLKDLGQSEPARWDKGLGDGSAHIMVSLYAADKPALEGRVRELAALIERRGLERIHEQPAAVLGARRDVNTGRDLPPGREHFGFADGFGQPMIHGVHDWPPLLPDVSPEYAGQRPIAAGEFLLGYEDEDREIAGLSYRGAREAQAVRDIGRDGTFMVYRKLQQDVARFRRVIREATATWGLRYGYDEEQLAAKIVGRWRDGTPLMRCPDRDGPSTEHDRHASNDFFFSEDPDGFKCPLGAHIRRAHPRDGIAFGDNLTRRHRLLRRGMSYGDELPDDTEGDRSDRGLIFICFNASVARQFEVVQGWLTDGNAFGLGHDPDFLLGAADGRDGKMKIQGERPFFLSPLEPLVITKGGEYLFLPGLEALRRLAANEWGWAEEGHRP